MCVILLPYVFSLSLFEKVKTHSPVHTFAGTTRNDYEQYITINNRPNLIAYPPFISSFGRVPFSSSYLILYSFLCLSLSFLFSSAVYVALSSLFFSVCVEWVDIYKNGGGCCCGLFCMMAGSAGVGAVAWQPSTMCNQAAAIVSAALLSRLFQLSTLSELTAPRSFTHSTSLRVSVLYSSVSFQRIFICWSSYVLCRKTFFVVFRIYNISRIDYT